MDIYIHETFVSLQGETTWSGFPSFFIRCAGCNLNCRHCDTPEARKQNKKISIDELVLLSEKYSHVHHITITGGEPLLQQEVIVLTTILLEKGHRVQIETNGSINIAQLPRDARKIVDVKTPSSGEAGSFIMGNLNFITENDELKFLIGTDEDYAFAREFCLQHLTVTPAIINFSPVRGLLKDSVLARRIIEDKMPVRLNIQLHQILGLQ